MVKSEDAPETVLRLYDEIIRLRKLAGRAARAISAGCVDTEDTLALVAELEAEARK